MHVTSTWKWYLICFYHYGIGEYTFSALTLLVGRQEGHPPVKKTERWGAGMVICLERGADLHMAQLMPLPLTVSCFSKIQIGFIFLVPAHLGSPGQRAVKRVCVCVCVLVSTVQYTSVSHCSLNFECPHLGYSFLSIILVLATNPDYYYY